jgi:hypothetical protein
MPENFLANDSELPSAEVDISASTAPVPEKKFVKVMVIGSRKGITSVIKMLHHLRFAEVREWSPPVPYEDSGELMSLLRKKVLE